MTTLFWLTVALHATYMVLIGYLVEDAAEHDVVRMVVLAAMLTIHFVSTDFGLGHREAVARFRLGRLTLCAGLLAGWGIGALGDVAKPAVALSAAFLAGAILLNVLNDELPERSEAHFLPFAGGALASGLLLATIG